MQSITWNGETIKTTCGVALCRASRWTNNDSNEIEHQLCVVPPKPRQNDNWPWHGVLHASIVSCVCVLFLFITLTARSCVPFIFAYTLD